MTTVEVLCVEPLVEVPRFSLSGRQEADHHLLLWQARGRSHFVVDGTPLVVTEGAAVWVPAGVDHQFTTAPNSALLPMFFDVRRSGRVADGPALITVDSHAETVCLALIGSQYSLVQPSADLEQMVLALVEAQVVARDETVMPTSLTALRVARHLVLNPADQRTLADWAGELHVSTRTLERAFLAETGLGWNRWRLAFRMRRAAQLLTAAPATPGGSGTSGPPVTVTDVARRVGFGTPSSFTRAFREHHGTTPTAYRALMGADAG